MNRRSRPTRRIRPLAPLGLIAVLATAASAAADWQPVVEGVDHQHVVHDGIDAHVVRVDLADARLRVVTSREAERGLTVSEFARRNSAIVAINGDYFDLEMRPLGFAMGACGVWAEAMRGVRRQEVVGVGERRARIFPRREPLRTPEPWMTGAISGWPAIVADCDPVERLPGSGHFTRAPHPRTAVGLSADGRELFLVVADGRREDTPGLTLPELARLMDEMGACSAVNLDGGGSSAMWIRDRIVNRPSDGLERPVVNHLAVIAAEDYAGCVESPADAPGR
ncbi:MAG: phosphodiester glycosidase family protein [Steroidobacteraceae bacterium]